MKMLFQLAGLAHFSILIASALTPGALDWKRHLAALPPFLRTLFWVYGAFIVLTVASLGTLTLVHADAMAAGEPVARSLCAFIAIFWLARLGVQLFVFDARPFLTTWFYKVGYHALTVAFTAFVVIYGWAAIFPGRSILP